MDLPSEVSADETGGVGCGLFRFAGSFDGDAWIALESGSPNLDFLWGLGCLPSAG